MGYRFLLLALVAIVANFRIPGIIRSILKSSRTVSFACIHESIFSTICVFLLILKSERNVWSFVFLTIPGKILLHDRDICVPFHDVLI